MLADSLALVEALIDAEVLADFDALVEAPSLTRRTCGICSHLLMRSLRQMYLLDSPHSVDALIEADVLADPLALVEALMDADVLAGFRLTC